MKRYEQDPSLTMNIVEGYDQKYGNYDYSRDARAIGSSQFRDHFIFLIQHYLKPGSRILVSGCNDGYEIGMLLGVCRDIQIVGIDLSKTAISRMMDSYPVNGIVGTMEHIPFPDDYFDLYISLRAIHSSGVDMNGAILEAKRVTRIGGAIVLSVSNGYLDEGVLKKGQYDYKTGRIDEKKPYEIRDALLLLLEGCTDVYSSETFSEIFIMAAL